MIALLDVNVLVALAWPNHVHHDAALGWFLKNSKKGWATCSVTQAGFLRVSSNRQALPEARSPEESILLLREITGLPGHMFWSDEVDVSGTESIEWARIRGHNQVTDAHLLALAISKKGRLATLDRGLFDLVPERLAKLRAIVNLLDEAS